MWFYIENFLDEQDFIKLTKKVKILELQSLEENDYFETDDDYLNQSHGREIIGKRQKKVKRVRYSGRSTFRTIYDDTINYFGNEFIAPVNKLKNCFLERGYNDVILSNLWVQYANSSSAFHRHRDGGLGRYKDINCFTTILYTHDNWNDSWGGKFKITDSGSESGLQELTENIFEYSPKPNSLLVWTREHPHWMTNIINTAVTRSFVGGCWYRDAEQAKLLK